MAAREARGRVGCFRVAPTRLTSFGGIHSAAVFTLPLFGQSIESRAMAMYAEDERLKNISDMKDAANTVGKGDAAQGSYILRESQKTFMRTSAEAWAAAHTASGEQPDIARGMAERTAAFYTGG